MQQFQETFDYLKDVAFANDNVGFAVGLPHWDDAAKEFRATIIKSSDGGVSWQPLNYGVGPALYAVAFPDPMHAWAVGDEGFILHTTDGGTTWAQLADWSPPNL